jgi:hypothetical protein
VKRPQLAPGPLLVVALQAGLHQRSKAGGGAGWQGEGAAPAGHQEHDVRHALAKVGAHAAAGGKAGEIKDASNGRSQWGHSTTGQS